MSDAMNSVIFHTDIADSEIALIVAGISSFGICVCIWAFICSRFA